MNASLLRMKFKGEIMDTVNLSAAGLFGLPFVNSFVRWTLECHWSQKPETENSHVQICNPALIN